MSSNKSSNVAENVWFSDEQDRMYTNLIAFQNIQLSRFFPCALQPFTFLVFDLQFVQDDTDIITGFIDSSGQGQVHDR